MYVCMYVCMYVSACVLCLQLTRKENILFSMIKKSAWEASERRLLMLYLRPTSIFISILCNSNPWSHYYSLIFSRLTLLQMLTFFDKQVMLSKHCRILPLICSMRGIGNQRAQNINFFSSEIQNVSSTALFNSKLKSFFLGISTL